MNFGTPVPLLIGIVLILGAVALFFLDKLKPGYGRDADKVYSILWLISGVFLLGHLNMELLASFQQLIMAGMLIAITIDNVSSRVPREDRYAAQGAVEPPSPRGDYYRPSRPVDYRSSSPRMNVRAELDNEPPYRPRFPEDRRMLNGREEASRRSGYYEDNYPERYNDTRDGYSDRPTSTDDRPVERLSPSGDRIRRRRPKSIDGRYTPNPNNTWDESSTGYAANSSGYSSSAASSDPYASNNRQDDDSYVDYRPVNYPEDGSSTDRPSSDYGGSQY